MTNSFNSDQLDAFEAVARLGNFSVAARELHITQPALSRRILSLEGAVGAQLFIRKSTGVELTRTGSKLLSFVQSRQAMEKEFRAGLGGARSASLGGVIRVAGYSTTLHQVAIPALAPLLRKHPRLQLHCVATQSARPREHESGLILRAEADFLFTIQRFEQNELEGQLLGELDLVVIESARYRQRTDTMLDARPEDLSTEAYFRRYPARRVPYERSHLYDEEGILKGVALGLGRAIVFRSMLAKAKGIRVVPGWAPIHWKLYLVHRRQAYYPRWFQLAKETLLKNCPPMLG